MRLLALLAAACCLAGLAEARPQRAAPGPHMHHNAQLSGAAANSMAPLTSEWRDESVRRLSSGPEGSDEVALSQSPYAWKPLVSESRRVRPSSRTSRYTPSTPLPAGPSGASRAPVVSGTSPSMATTLGTSASTGRRLLTVGNHTDTSRTPDDGWVLLSAGGSTRPAEKMEKAAGQAEAPSSGNTSVASAREMTEREHVDEQVLSSIRAISTALLEQSSGGGVSIPSPGMVSSPSPPISSRPATPKGKPAAKPPKPARLPPTRPPSPRPPFVLTSPGPTDKTFQVDDHTALAEDGESDGRFLTARPPLKAKPSQALSPQQHPQAQPLQQPQDEDAWLPVSLSVPSSVPSKPVIKVIASRPPTGTGPTVNATQQLAEDSTSPAPKTHYHYSSTFRPSEHYAAASTVPPLRPSPTSPRPSLTSLRPPVTARPPLRPQRPPLRPPGPSPTATASTTAPGKTPSHFTFSATISPTGGAGHHQHYQEQGGQGVVSVIKRPVTMHHSAWGVGTPNKPGHGATVINNYNDPSWYPKPPATPPPKPPHIIIIEDKVPEYQMSKPQMAAPTPTPNTAVKCPNIVITASSLAENHNGVANKEGLQGCSELNIVIQSSAANTNSLPVGSNEPIILGPAPSGPPPPSAPMTPTAPAPTQLIVTRPKPKPPRPPPAAQADAPPAEAPAPVPAQPAPPTNNVGFWGSLFNGSATRFGISFWSGVLLAPVIVLMAVGSLLTPWLVPYILSRRSDDYRGLGLRRYPATHRDDAALRLRDAQRRALDAQRLGQRLDQRLDQQRRDARCKASRWAGWRRRYRRTVPADTVWWDDGVPPGWP